MTESTTGRSKQLTADDTLAVLDEAAVPFVTSKMVAERESCTRRTALNRLTELVEQGRLERYDLNGRQTLFFRPDYQAANSLTDRLLEHLEVGEIDVEHVEAFAQNPYKVLPKAESEYYVVVPRFVPFHVGHLHEQDDAWQVFIVNKYVAWFEDLPDEIRGQVDIQREYEQATVDDNILELGSEDERDRAWEDLGGRDGGLHARKGDNKIKIQRGKEFDVIADLVERGNLPFAAHPIRDDDLRAEPEGVSLRSYQERAWETMAEYGQIGVYWPPGTGKTFLGLYAGERISGDKLVVVPTSTLEQQWEDRIQERTERSWEWDVRTYQYLTQSRYDRLEDYQGDDAPALTIFDECHRLPANTFSKLATIDTRYRIGLSASPYREDDRTDYIFALTGVPVGIDWEELVAIGAVEKPEIRVYLYRTDRLKREDTVQLAREKPGKGIIFCDGLDAGEALAEELSVPFVSGDTPKGDRLDIVGENRVTVVSRVGDEGLSVDDLDWTIEHQFHGSSRRQELQRTGRVMHGDDSTGQHIVQMTDEEAEEYSDRLYSLEERGMEIRYERRA